MYIMYFNYIHPSPSLWCLSFTKVVLLLSWLLSLVHLLGCALLRVCICYDVPFCVCASVVMCPFACVHVMMCPFACVHLLWCAPLRVWYWSFASFFLSWLAQVVYPFLVSLQNHCRMTWQAEGTPVAALLPVRIGFLVVAVSWLFTWFLGIDLFA